jgi:hypothetical protein
MPDPCAGKPAVMHWPSNDRCVPDTCNQPGTGQNKVRDAQGNCVTKTGPCDEPGARRNPNGVCVPSPGRPGSPSPGGYYPGQGYGPYEIEYGPSGVSVCNNNKGDINCDEAPNVPNPVGPDSSFTVRCTKEGSQWRCTEVPNSP